MAIPVSQPHTVTHKRGTVTRDSGHNAATRDFTSPVFDQQLTCMFQTRTGDVGSDAEGRQFTLNGILFVVSVAADVQVEDRIEVSLPGLSEKFRVATRDAKYDVQGKFSHFEISLEREIRN